MRRVFGKNLLPGESRSANLAQCDIARAIAAHTEKRDRA